MLRRADLGRLALLTLQFRDPLLIEPDEVDRIDVERREAAVAYTVGDDLPREGEQRRGPRS